jgi:hypothetical protein
MKKLQPFLKLSRRITKARKYNTDEYVCAALARMGKKWEKI